jgi:large subunit ribosomal protein L29
MAKEKRISEMSLEELQAKLVECKESLFNFRFQKSLQQLEHPEQIGRVKKEIARVNTFIRKYELEVK